MNEIKMASRFLESHRCADKSGFRPQLEGVNVRTLRGSSGVHVCGTDGRHLIYSHFDAEEKFGADSDITIATKTAKNAIKLSAGDGKVEMTVSHPDDYLSPYTLRPGGNGTEISDEGVGIFPKYASIIPSQNPSFAVRLDPWVLKNLCDSVIRTSGIRKDSGAVMVEFRYPRSGDDQKNVGPVLLRTPNESGGETIGLIMPIL